MNIANSIDLIESKSQTGLAPLDNYISGLIYEEEDEPVEVKPEPIDPKDSSESTESEDISENSESNDSDSSFTD